MGPSEDDSAAGAELLPTHAEVQATKDLVVPIVTHMPRVAQVMKELPLNAQDLAAGVEEERRVLRTLVAIFGRALGRTVTSPSEVAGLDDGGSRADGSCLFDSNF